MIKYPIYRYKVYDVRGNSLRLETTINSPNPGEIWMDTDLGNPYPWYGYRRCDVLNGVEGGSFRSEELARDYATRKEYK